jgi:hypothetical protein
MFFTNVGQMIHDHTPNPIRNNETRLVKTTKPVSQSQPIILTA